MVWFIGPSEGQGIKIVFQIKSHFIPTFTIQASDREF